MALDLRLHVARDSPLILSQFLDEAENTL